MMLTGGVFGDRSVALVCLTQSLALGAVPCRHGTAPKASNCVGKSKLEGASPSIWSQKTFLTGQQFERATPFLNAEVTDGGRTGFGSQT